VSGPSAFEVRLLGPGDAAVLDRVMPGAFDHEIDPPTAAAFLADRTTTSPLRWRTGW
jgi:hypothetical protein